MDPEFRAMDTEGKLEYLYNLSLSKDAIIETLNSTNYNQEQEISVIKVDADQFFLICMRHNRRTLCIIMYIYNNLLMYILLAIVFIVLLQ